MSCSEIAFVRHVSALSIQLVRKMNHETTAEASKMNFRSVQIAEMIVLGNNFVDDDRTGLNHSNLTWKEKMSQYPFQNHPRVVYIELLQVACEAKSQGSEGFPPPFNLEEAFHAFKFRL
ncbi:hypothetical protein CIHG_02837 [Coccidioides immitis H538.4]|uniref:Uncharacterized protein n=3 Tax=Coccidioides immitis TaxID=5501 RepID=A0A0J8R4S9_COCIT|nr:hypothetical protein CIRG_07549 [Coccidioides immitis RMSCC 2394]KMU79771.1 hypothetical protein CISG_08051 [Coccidioides immitis RMSCC 3703]KMU85055.1 hypothetical protein CIHG_02837 [Coccidioides immitis H538.4]